MSKFKLIILIICGLILASALFCFISLSYTSLEMVTARGLEDRVNNRQKALEDASKRLAALSEWRNISEIYEKFKKDYIMNMDDFSQYRDNLQSIFNKYHLISKLPGYRYKSFFNDYLRVEISFTLSGTYPNLKRFIHEIMNDKRLILIKRINFSRNMQRGDISASFQMEVYLAR